MLPYKRGFSTWGPSGTTLTPSWLAPAPPPPFPKVLSERGKLAMWLEQTPPHKALVSKRLNLGTLV